MGGACRKSLGEKDYVKEISGEKGRKEVIGKERRG
jgi:hypothetical protein